MLRTIFMIGLFALLGLFVLKLAFGIVPMLFSILFFLLGLAIKIAVFGVIAYVIIRIVSPDTARRLREKWSGPSM